MYSKLVRGTYPHITLRHNLDAMAKGLFEMFGKLVDIALLKDCPGPHFFTPMVTGFISDIPKKPHLTEVPDEYEFKTQLTSISTCNDEASSISLANSFPELFDTGYAKAIVTLEDKNELVNAYVKHVGPII